MTLLKLLKGNPQAPDGVRKTYRLLPDVPRPGLRYVFRFLLSKWPHAQTMELHEGGKKDGGVEDR